MDESIVLDWSHVWGVIGGLFALLCLFYKLIDKKFDKQDTYMREAKKDTDAKFDKLQNSIKEIGDKLASFEKHAEHRLTKIEMEAKNTNQRLLTIENFLIPKKVYRLEEPVRPSEEPKEN